jgi:hypothetical protein
MFLRTLLVLLKRGIISTSTIFSRISYCLRFDAPSFREWFPTFRNNALPLSSVVKWTNRISFLLVIFYERINYLYSPDIYQNNIFCTSRQLNLHLISEHPQTSSEVATATVSHCFLHVAVWDKSRLYA